MATPFEHDYVRFFTDTTRFRPKSEEDFIQFLIHTRNETDSLKMSTNGKDLVPFCMIKFGS